MVEVNVAMALGLAHERVLVGGDGIAKLLGGAARCVRPDGCFRVEISYETLVLQTMTYEFLRKSRTKRSFWRLGVRLWEEMLVLQTRSVILGGSLV